MSDLQLAPLTGWGITTGAAGHYQQVLGILESLVDDPKMITVTPRGIQKFLAPWVPPIANAEISPPWPDIVVVSGRQSAPYAKAISKRSQGKTFSVVLQNPTAPPSWFDFLWMNQHDAPEADNIFKTLTAPHRITNERIATAAKTLKSEIEPLNTPCIGLILGGPNSDYSFSEDEAFHLGQQVANLAKIRNASVLVTPSRRTGAARLNAICKALSDTPTWVWDGSGENPYFGILGLSDELVVTCDSINMMGEAAFTGKPLHIAKLDGKNGKFSRFHKQIISLGAANWLHDLHDPWQCEPINSHQTIVKEILQRYHNKMSKMVGNPLDKQFK